MAKHREIELAKDPVFKKRLTAFFEACSSITPAEQKSDNWAQVLKEFRKRTVDNPQTFLDDLNLNLSTRNDYSLIAEAQGNARHHVVNFYKTCLQERGIDPAELLNRCEESPLLVDDICLEVDGHRVTTDLMRRLTHLSYIEAKLTLPNSSCILEVGAGHGALARVLKTANPGATYIIIDLPETLYYSTGFLSANFPDANILLGDEDSLKDIRDSDIGTYDFIFLPIGLEHHLHGLSVDLFVNTHSLGEIPPEVSRYWFDFFQKKIKTRQYFMVNRFLNRRKWGSTYIGNVCSTGFDKDWHILDWEVDPKYSRSAHEVWESRYLMTSGVRRDVPLTDREAAVLSQGRCEDSKSEPWYQQVLDVQSPSGSALIDPNYAFHERNYDMSRTGSLFRCWDAVRLHKSQESLTLMLNMLRFLAGGGRAFNEAHVYAADLEALYPPRFQQGNLTRYD